MKLTKFEMVKFGCEQWARWLSKDIKVVAIYHYHCDSVAG